MKISADCNKLINADKAQDNVEINGWVRTKRETGGLCFIEINDGSCLANLQLIIEESSKEAWSVIKNITTGASIFAQGNLAASPGGNQDWELRVFKVIVLGESPENYPLQKKRHSDEFLRQIAHLRVRTNKYGAMARIRSKLSFSVHEYFQRHKFHYVTTPIITGSDCEGAGEMFNVSTVEEKTEIDAEYFFGKPAALTVSGQLSVENYCLALSKVYTFGPTFRAENSNTSRHISEFWMIEPEVAFATLEDNIELATDFVRHMARSVQDSSLEDLALFAKYVDKTLMHRLEILEGEKYETISYTDSIELLNKSGKKFEYQPKWGTDLQTEHERFLTEEYFKRPVFVINWPKEIKPFYMRINDDEKTVSSMDLLVPIVGELIGGSAREERLSEIRDRLEEMNLSEEDYWWYLDTRRFGSAAHAGFGVGFERLMMLFTGISNIRDVIPFPRTPKSLEF